jgi:hypothetical protein
MNGKWTLSSPIVPLPVWRELSRSFLEFALIDPWSVLSDERLFAVDDPFGAGTGYACVMGALGQVRGLCLFRGPKSLEVYTKLLSGELDPESDQVLGSQDALTAELAEPEFLQPPDKEVLRALDVKFTRRAERFLPRFRSHVPGHAPWFLNVDEAQFLISAIRCAEDLVRRVASGRLAWPATPGAIPIYRLAGRTRSGQPRYRRTTTRLPIVRPSPHGPIQFNAARIEQILSKNPGRLPAWEADVFVAPVVLQDRPRPYIPKNVLVVEPQSGFVLDVYLESPEAEPAQMIADAVVRSGERHGMLPSELRVRDGKTATALSPLGKALGFSVQERRPLTSVDQARRAMNNFLRKKR